MLHYEYLLPPLQCYTPLSSSRIENITLLLNMHRCTNKSQKLKTILVDISIAYFKKTFLQLSLILYSQKPLEIEACRLNYLLRDFENLVLTVENIYFWMHVLKESSTKCQCTIHVGDW